MSRKDIVVIGSKGSGFTHITQIMAKVMAEEGYELVGRIQPQSGGAVGRKLLIPPFLGTGEEKFSIATTERTEGAETLIMIDPVGRPAYSIQEMTEGGCAIIDTSSPISKYWLNDVKDEAKKKKIRLVLVDTNEAMKDIEDIPKVRNMFLFGMAVSLSLPSINEETISKVLLESYGDFGEKLFKTVKAGIEYGRKIGEKC
ncbi:MAG: hypothetical protein ACE5K4_04160 [Candidatus Hydrothermarchaeota archaeon]